MWFLMWNPVEIQFQIQHGSVIYTACWKSRLDVSLHLTHKSRIIINRVRLICWHIKYSLQFSCMSFYCLGKAWSRDDEPPRYPFQKHNFLYNQHLEVFLLCLKLWLHPGMNSHTLHILYFTLKTTMHYVKCCKSAKTKWDVWSICLCFIYPHKIFQTKSLFSFHYH